MFLQNFKNKGTKKIFSKKNSLSLLSNTNNFFTKITLNKANLKISNLLNKSIPNLNKVLEKKKNKRRAYHKVKMKILNWTTKKILLACLIKWKNIPNLSLNIANPFPQILLNIQSLITNLIWKKRNKNFKRKA